MFTWSRLKALRSMRCFSHVPVMADEVVNVLKPMDGKVYIDMTFGGGGHTRKLLSSNKSIKIVALDRDPVAYHKAKELATEVSIKSKNLKINQEVIPVHGKFSEALEKIHLSGIPYDSVDGILFDLGASSMQYDDGTRGFSLSQRGTLDMRMDTTNSSDITAEDVVNNMSQENLGLIIKKLGGERRSRKIANAIVDARTLLGRIKTTVELAQIISSSSPMNLDALGGYSHPGTKTFQAIRIFVNNELNEFNYGLQKIRSLLKVENPGDEIKSETDYKGGVAVVLSFHSLEDTIAKRQFTSKDVGEPVQTWLSQHDRIYTNTVDSDFQFEKTEAQKIWRPIFKHVLKPSDTEVAANPRARSAKLRAAVRIA